MAFTTSGIFGPNIALTLGRAANSMILTATGATYGTAVATGTTQDSWKIALYGTTPTPNFYDTVAHNAYNGTGGQWVAGNEVHDTGANWPAGGVALSTPVLNATASPLNWSAAAVNVASTTIAGIYGCLIYDTTATIVTNIALLCLAFAGSPYGTNNGTFGITWSGSGIWTWAGPNNGP